MVGVWEELWEMRCRIEVCAKVGWNDNESAVQHRVFRSESPRAPQFQELSKASWVRSAEWFEWREMSCVSWVVSDELCETTCVRWAEWGVLSELNCARRVGWGEGVKWVGWVELWVGWGEGVKWVGWVELCEVSCMERIEWDELCKMNCVSWVGWDEFRLAAWEKLSGNWVIKESWVRWVVLDQLCEMSCVS